MHLHQALILAVLLLAGCAAPKRPQSAQDIKASFIQDFERKYAEYRIPPDRLPNSNMKKVSDLRKTPLWKDLSAEMTLHLGKRTGDGGGRFRTSSRYEIRSASGALLRSAGSVLASADLNDPDLQPSVRIAFDLTSRNLLVVEEHSWSVERIILLPIDEGPQPARYVRIPSRQSLEPFGQYEIVGFLDGRLFIKQDGAAFAFPLDVLQTYTDLEYSIGSLSPTSQVQQAVAHTLPPSSTKKEARQDAS